MPDLADLTLEQQLAVRSAAHNLHREFEGIFGTEIIELFLATSYEQFATQARIPTHLVLFAERFARQHAAGPTGPAGAAARPVSAAHPPFPKRAACHPTRQVGPSAGSRHPTAEGCQPRARRRWPR